MEDLLVVSPIVLTLRVVALPASNAPHQLMLLNVIIVVGLGAVDEMGTLVVLVGHPPRNLTAWLITNNGKLLLLLLTLLLLDQVWWLKVVVVQNVALILVLILVLCLVLIEEIVLVL